MIERMDPPAFNAGILDSTVTPATRSGEQLVQPILRRTSLSHNTTATLVIRTNAPWKGGPDDTRPI
jgi:hypothetical protein